jgi:DNA repair protein RecN (Recombination protein N)
MLLHLHIRDFAIVPTLEQDFRPGFTAISGETGAGKSILVDALGLLLGARSDAAWVRAGAERAELTAEFDLAANPEARAWLDAQELAQEGGCLLRRTIRANGRSSAWINGTPVTVQQLSKLGNRLVEVHGQNEHVRLARARRQLELLDETGSYHAELARVAEAYEEWHRLDEELRALNKRTALPPGEAEFLRHQLRELEEHALEAEALAALEEEHGLLANADDLLAALAAATSALEDEEAGAQPLLNRALQAIEPHAELDRALTEARDMLRESMINAQEAAATLRAAGERVELNPGRLQELSQTLSTLADLARKHGVRLEELPQVRDTIAERLLGAEQAVQRLGQLEEERSAALARYRDAAAELGKYRRTHSRQLAGAVETIMKDLGMAGGRFQVELVSDPEAAPGRLGDDRARILVSANSGTPPAPLSKVASGGELSRISLAIKVVTSGGGGRVQVFDEIDAGVGGDTANAVGRLLSEAAAGGQALCVTHLAQVAVRADQQLQVSKREQDGGTAVDARLLEAGERVEEIARMLGGQVSEQSRAHAREMLEAARSTLQ